MDIDNIINGITAKRNEIDNIEDKEDKAVLDRIIKAEKQIETLAPRIRDIFKIAQALTDNGFWLGEKKSYDQSAPYFLTDHIDHRVGLFVNHPYYEAPGRDYTLLGYFGIANGGACGDNDLKIDRDGKVQRWNFSIYDKADKRYKQVRDRYLKDLEWVLERFDDYEAKFYEYATNPLPYGNQH